METRQYESDKFRDEGGALCGRGGSHVRRVSNGNWNYGREEAKLVVGKIGGEVERVVDVKG